MSKCTSKSAAYTESNRRCPEAGVNMCTWNF